MSVSNPLSFLMPTKAHDLVDPLNITKALTGGDKPDVAAVVAPGVAQAAKSTSAGRVASGAGGLGAGSPSAAETFLTGTAGVDPTKLNLGRASLLGG